MTSTRKLKCLCGLNGQRFALIGPFERLSCPTAIVDNRLQANPTRAPLVHRVRTSSQFAGDLHVSLPVCGSQDHASSLRQLLERLAFSHKLLQGCSLFLAQGPFRYFGPFASLLFFLFSSYLPYTDLSLHVLEVKGDLIETEMIPCQKLALPHFPH
jgi:hypothetical protein